MAPLSLVIAAVGLVLLLFGRKLFWVYIAISGFVLGTQLGAYLGSNLGTPAIVFIGLIMGGLFGVLAIYLQKPMASIAGFLLGGTLVLLLFLYFGTGGNLFALMFYRYGATDLAVFVIGGLGCAVLVWVTFEWALIIISSVTGSLMAVGGLSPLVSLPGAGYLLFFLVLAVLGMFVQARMLARPVPAAAPPALPGQHP